jgi:hypothetical protein
MGSGRWDTGTYRSLRSARVTANMSDFAYSDATSKSYKPGDRATNIVHDSLKPQRIQDKKAKVLESLDSEEHPQSNAVIVCFDVTGSNFDRAVEAQSKLPNLMDALQKYLTDPQIAIMANDDYHSVGVNALQASDFESDIRVDEHLRNIWLVGQGGGNSGESYDLPLYLAARKTTIDCFNKRGKKGYMFLYADEPIFAFVDRNHVKDVFGDSLQEDIPIADIIAEARERWNVFVIWPTGGYAHARSQYVSLFGAESVLTLQHPNMICELIASTIGLNEAKSTEDIKQDLLAMNVGEAEAQSIVTSAASTVTPAAASGAARL